MIVNISGDPGLDDWVRAGGQPVVNTTAAPVRGIPAVCASSSGIARLAWEHFAARGFQNFAFVGFPGYGQARKTAFALEVERHRGRLWSADIHINPSRWNAFLDEEAASGTELLELLSAAPKPLAVLATVHDAGRVVCLACQRLGMNIPAEVAVLGIFDGSSARTCVPPLSSIRTPNEAIGYQAMELLQRLMSGEPAPQAAIELDPLGVIDRESTGACGSRETEVARVTQHLRDRACSGLSIAQIADELKISRSSFERLCLLGLGRSPHDEMLRVRFQRAKQLLRTSKLPVVQIAKVIGYQQHAYFSTAFRKFAGMSPTEYRAAERGEALSD
jgi:LacI family transcriptional regulator